MHFAAETFANDLPQATPYNSDVSAILSSNDSAAGGARLHKPSVVCVGETLWDFLPSGRFMGGAPFNVAAHLAKLGLHTTLISRLGDDELGKEAADRMMLAGLDLSALQFDATHPTGEARALLDDSGSATYAFLSPAAWDAIEASPAALASVQLADALVFGTLAQRAPLSSAAVLHLAAAARYRIFDPNLRAPHIDRALTLGSLSLAQMVKLNEVECALFGEWLNCGADPAALLHSMQREFGVGSLCITRGSAGALLFHNGSWYEQVAFPCAVVDTVGAGDSFLAMLIAELLRGSRPDVALRRAARLAAYVASQPGAVPDYDPVAFTGPDRPE